MPSQTFNYTGGAQTWTVPAGVTSVTVDMAGAGGGRGYNGSTFPASAGKGGRVQATISATPGQTWQINVGGQGKDGNSVASNPVPGGWNGGGAGNWLATVANGGSGGGGTDIRIGGTSLTDRVLVASGGGGSSYFNAGSGGGDGGGLTGAAGLGANHGQGGTQSAGGAAPSGGTAGSLGTGSAAPASSCGGGGGGGYYGGSGGGTNSGGGGGSSYASATATGVTHTAGYQAADGYVILTWALPPAMADAASVTLTAQDATVTPGSLAAQASPASLAVAANDAAVITGVPAQAASAALTLTAQPPATALVPISANVSLAAQAASAAFGLLESASLSLAPQSALAVPPPLIKQFHFTGSPQTWTVPAGVFSVTVDMAGGGGGGNPYEQGLGGGVIATLPATPGETWTITVGGQGYWQGAQWPDGGGSNNAYGGGGSSDIRIGGTGLIDRVLVAGAGGGGVDVGGGSYLRGGDGGGPNGTAGAGSAGGGGGTQTAGGTTLSPFPAGFGIGGAASPVAGVHSGGGGGGWFGGGGGGAPDGTSGAGGGGSSYAAPIAQEVTFMNGTNASDGHVTLTWYVPAAAAAGALTFAAQDASVSMASAQLESAALTLAAQPAVSGTIAYAESAALQAVAGDAVLSAGTVTLQPGSAALTATAVSATAAVVLGAESASLTLRPDDPMTRRQEYSAPALIVMSGATTVIPSDRIRAFSMRRGRQDELARYEAGTATLTLDNHDGMFDPLVAGSVAAAYPLLTRLSVQCIWRNNTYPVFAGYVGEGSWQPTGDPRSHDALVTLQLVDWMGVASRMEMPPNLWRAIIGTRYPLDEYNYYAEPMAWWTGETDSSVADGGQLLDRIGGFHAFNYGYGGFVSAGSSLVPGDPAPSLHLYSAATGPSGVLRTNTALPSTSQFAVKLWFSCEQVTSGTTYLLVGTDNPDGTAARWALRIDTAGKLVASIWNTGGTNRIDAIVTPLSGRFDDGQTHYVSMYVTGGRLVVECDNLNQLARASASYSGRGGGWVFFGFPNNASSTSLSHVVHYGTSMVPPIDDVCVPQPPGGYPDNYRVLWHSTYFGHSPYVRAVRLSEVATYYNSGPSIPIRPFDVVIASTGAYSNPSLNGYSRGDSWPANLAEAINDLADDLLGVAFVGADGYVRVRDWAAANSDAAFATISDSPGAGYVRVTSRGRGGPLMSRIVNQVELDYQRSGLFYDYLHHVLTADQASIDQWGKRVHDFGETRWASSGLRAATSQLVTKYRQPTIEIGDLVVEPWGDDTATTAVLLAELEKSVNYREQPPYAGASTTLNGKYRLIGISWDWSDGDRWRVTLKVAP